MPPSRATHPADPHNPRPPLAARPPSARAARNRHRAPIILAAALMYAFALIICLPALTQSLWYDEIYSLVHFESASWTEAVTIYSPNNHVLYTLVAKAISAQFPGSDIEWPLRLPSALAGAGVGIALAWPLRRRWPILALLLAFCAALNPWLVSFSTEARGYALLILLSVLATNWLPRKRRGIEWKYAAILAAAVYTIPLGLLLFAGHGIAMFACRRRALRRWLVSAAIAAILAGLLYLPFLNSLKSMLPSSAAAVPSATSKNADVPPRGATGWSWNFPTLALAHAVLGRPGGIAAAGWSAAVLLTGIPLAWRIRRWRVTLISFIVPTIIAMILPLALTSAAQARFVFWLVPLFSISIAAIAALPLALLRNRSASKNFQPATDRILKSLFAIFAIAFPVAVSIPFLIQIWQIPKQPMREAAAHAQALAGPGERIFGVYIGAYEAFLYIDIRVHPPAGVFTPANLSVVEASSPNLVAMVFQLDMLETGAPALADLFRRDFVLTETLPGRLSDAQIWRRKSPPE